MAETGLWSALPFAAVLMDGAYRIVALNPAAELFLNRSETQLRGQNIEAVFESEARLEPALRRLRSGGSAIAMQDVLVRVAGREPVLCRLNAALLPSDEPRILVTLQSNRSFQELSQNPARSAAKSAIGMAEMLAHEIKNPLAGISGAAQLLSMTVSADDQELTGMIVAETKRITKLLEQVEQFGNLLPPDLKPVNVHDVLDRARKSALLGFAKSVDIIEEYDPSLPEALADADQLLQVVLNLIRNASEALGRSPSAEIRLRTRYDGGLRVRGTDGVLRRVPLQVEICDNGPGLPPAIADAIFDPFVSGRENGTGLGLALVSKIVSDHGGLIGVKSTPGRTVFTVSLPVADLKTGES